MIVNEMKKFSDLPLNSWIVKQCKSIGLETATAVQAACIPPILEGKDCIGCERTGSGKTLAFALPILQKLCEDPYGIFALVVTPTRELATQISEQFSVLGSPINLRCLTVVGGMDMVVQGSQLNQKPHVVVATPGRMADLIESGAVEVQLQKLKFLVLDEADRMLGGGFDEQLASIMKTVNKKRQTLLFSATMTDSLERAVSFSKNEPFVWVSPDIGETGVATVEELDQRYILMPKDVKDGYLVDVISKFTKENPQASAILFVDTCRSCAVLGMMLNELTFPCVALHSMAPQRERRKALTKFKSRQVPILVATDVASRGLDIPTVELVLNYNVPRVPKDYVHRVGRTARAGRGGQAITLVTQHDVRLVHAIEEQINAKLVEHPVKEKDVLSILTQVAVTRRECEIKLSEQDFDEKRVINKRKKLILQGIDPDEVQEQKKKKAKRKKEK